MQLWERAADDIAGALAASQVRARRPIDDLYGPRLAALARADIALARQTFPHVDAHPPDCLCRHRALLAVAAYRCETRVPVDGESVFDETIVLLQNYLARRS